MKKFATPIPRDFAYLNFCEKVRRKVKEDNPTASFSKIASILRNTWNNMSEHEKQVYDIKK
jgi:hypothetical protein